MPTLGAHLRRLVEIGGPPLGTSCPDASALRPWGSLGDELADLLAAANGFYAFESALLVRPMRSASGVLGVLEWNRPDRWKAAYGELADRILCFGEDLFGGQFAIGDDGVVAFDPETGERARLGGTLDEWARELLEDYETLTGCPLAHAWQALHGPLDPEQRLVPKVPFVLGGDFDVSNLRIGDSTAEMRARAALALRIRDLPDGTAVELVVE